MEIVDTSDKVHRVTLPPSCVDPKKYKVGDSISYKIHGKVKSVDEEYGVVVELIKEGEDDMEEFESLDDEGQKKKIKNQMESKLQEY